MGNKKIENQSITSVRQREYYTYVSHTGVKAKTTPIRGKYAKKSSKSNKNFNVQAPYLI